MMPCTVSPFQPAKVKASKGENWTPASLSASMSVRRVALPSGARRYSWSGPSRLLREKTRAPPPWLTALTVPPEVRGFTAPVVASMEKSRPAPTSSAVTSRDRPSGDQARDSAERSQAGSTSCLAPVFKSITQTPKRSASNPGLFCAR